MALCCSLLVTNILSISNVVCFAQTWESKARKKLLLSMRRHHRTGPGKATSLACTVTGELLRKHRDGLQERPTDSLDCTVKLLLKWHMSRRCLRVCVQVHWQSVFCLGVALQPCQMAPQATPLHQL